jgi:hypothetical protein
MSWEQAVAKFERLAAPYTHTTRRQAIIDTVAHLETKQVEDLTSLLSTLEG